MKLKKHNKKGVTLVEVIIAMTLLSMMAGMLVTVAVNAKNTNRDNYFRSKEMNEQALNAEQYNDAKNYDMNDIKVNKYVGDGQTDNDFALEADWGDGIKWNTTAYGYKTKLNSIDSKAGYQLKFLQGTNVNITPNVNNGEYWVKFYNDSGAEITNFVMTPTTTGGKFFDANNNSSGNSVPLTTGIGGVSQFGFIATSSGDYFGFTETNDDLYSASHVPSTSDFILSNETTFKKYCETDSNGNLTGYIVIHYMGGTTYLTQAEFDAQP